MVQKKKKNMRKRPEYVSEPAEWSIKPKDATIGNTWNAE